MYVAPGAAATTEIDTSLIQRESNPEASRKVLLPGGITTSKIECVAKKTGDQMIVAKWNSTQVKGITAVKFIEITE
ncbi:hypothetical protein JD844_002740 [Phrynosoma platyrhinos]|uniref:Uncharacterized protein n=1 Tax=Phrynosoma platyrhinos TaxID=52577 RepID=A0ABQ7TBW9_PHRPL|nr:hypothetical protein JD844_002740 [Phrynosoma platyrhinos]